MTSRAHAVHVQRDPIQHAPQSELEGLVERARVPLEWCRQNRREFRESRIANRASQISADCRGPLLYGT